MALEVFERAGVRVPRKGRARRAQSLLERLGRGANVDLSNDRAQAELSAAHRTAWEMSVIAYGRYVASRGANPFALDRMQRMMGGAILPDVTDTQARDAQFEMFVAAALRLGGADVRSAEPDLTFLLGPERVGIAAKRVSSLSERQLSKHIRKAADQIHRSGRRGFVALNLDSRLADIDLPVASAERLPLFEAAFQALESHEEWLANLPNVLGIMVYGYAAKWHTGESLPELTTATPLRWFHWWDDAGTKLLFEEFVQRWGRGFEASMELFWTKGAEVP